MEYSDLEDMIDVLSIAIVRGETEEAFFRRSAGASTSDAAQALFSEIAGELSRYRQSLEARRQKLLDAVEGLEKTGGAERDESDREEWDPVCQLPVDEECQEVSEYGGRQYRFCSKDCRRAFALDPTKYLAGVAARRRKPRL